MKRLLPWIRFALSAALVWLLYRSVPLDELRATLTSVRPGLFAAVFALTFLNTVISAVKWRCFLRAAGLDVPLRALVGTYLTGSFFNLFLPSSVGGDVYRVYDIRRATGRGADSLASVFADRLSGLLALAALGFFFSIAGIRFLPDPRVALLPAGFCVALLVLVWALRRQSPLYAVLRVARLDRIGPVKRLTAKFLGAFRVYGEQPGLAARVLALSFLFQSSIIVSLWLLSRSIGLDVPFLAFCIFIPVISFLEALPISIFGLGVRDASYVFFFGQVGVPPVEALSMAVMYVVLSLLYGLLGGAVYAVRGRRAAVAAAGPDGAPGTVEAAPAAGSGRPA